VSDGCFTADKPTEVPLATISVSMKEELQDPAKFANKRLTRMMIKFNTMLSSYVKCVMGHSGYGGCDIVRKLALMLSA